jgi:hypothetical protein
MAQCFGVEGARTIDGFQIERKETDDPLYRRTTREYCFRAVPESHRRIDAIGAAAPPLTDPTPEPGEVLI